MSNTHQIVRLHPFHYLHILDNNTLITRLETGPAVLTLKEHERLVQAPEPMIVIPPRHYCKIKNPISRKHDEAEIDQHGHFVLMLGESQIRFHQAPFPLYPGEEIELSVRELQIVPADCALRVRCLQDFVDEEGHSHIAGDEWLFCGPSTYMPRVETDAGSQILESIIVQPNQALRLRARRQFVDCNGIERAAGELWLHREVGAYLPALEEEVEATVNTTILTPDVALHLRAVRTFVDDLGKNRLAGEEWLITSELSSTHCPSVCEEVVGIRKITVLTDMEYCIISDPVDQQGNPQYGRQELRRGPACFFLQPGESFASGGVCQIEVLEDQQALLLQALAPFVDGDISRKAGDQWMIQGPGEYVPRVDVDILERRKRIPLDDNEGIYVRDLNTGEVRAVQGPQSYMLSANEQLWSKFLPKVVDDLLVKHGGPSSRDPTRLVTFHAPHNSAVQVYDYRAHKARVVFGPGLVRLGPNEHFTVLSLSGGKPKRPHLIKDIALLLGPDFMTDYVIVETADHAKLELRLSYNYQFQISPHMQDPSRLFSLPDFVGEGCNAIASRVRAAVAAAPFDEFHKNSARIIRAAVFDVDDNGHINKDFLFPENHLLITNIDIKAVEPVDQRTRDMLQRSVQLAIDITTRSVQLAAQHKAEREEQAAKGELGNLRIHDQTAIESAKQHLISLRSDCLVSERRGTSAAEASASAEAKKISAEADVESANLRAKARKHRTEAQLEALRKRYENEIQFATISNQLSIDQAKALAAVEASKFEKIVAAIGADTIADIARAGPEMQAQLLQGLGLQSLLITDGHSPINLFNTASSLVSHNS